MTQQATTRHGVILMLTAVMPTMAIIALVPVLPLLLREFADVPGAAVLVPMALTIPALCVALFSPLAGWLSDKVGRKRLLIAALVGYAGFGLLPLMLEDLRMILAARVALGVTEAIIMTVATALVGDYFTGERREKWVSIQIATASVSAIVLIAAGGALGEALGSRGPFWLYLLALPVAIAAAMILFEPAKTVATAPAAAGKAQGIAML
ncbi:MAG: MFS transporter, partial [Sphingomonadales bacterium]